MSTLALLLAALALASLCERPLARAFEWLVAQVLALVLTPLMWLPFRRSKW